MAQCSFTQSYLILAIRIITTQIQYKPIRIKDDKYYIFFSITNSKSKIVDIMKFPQSIQVSDLQRAAYIIRIKLKFHQNKTQRYLFTAYDDCISS